MSDFVKVELNCGQITHDVIDGEVVIINLINGNYYSTDGIGAEIWAWLVQGHDVAETTAELLGRYDAAVSEIKTSLDKFMQDLLREGLVVSADNNGKREDPDMAAVSESLLSKRAFQQPVLNIYSDMQDFLLLDPIHEVGDSGWPSKKEEPVSE